MPWLPAYFQTPGNVPVPPYSDIQGRLVFENKQATTAIPEEPYFIFSDTAVVFYAQSR